MLTKKPSLKESIQCPRVISLPNFGDEFLGITLGGVSDPQ
jgi:hypothetical protein